MGLSRTNFIAVLIAFCPAISNAREILPGLLSFDEPPGYHNVAPRNDPGDNPFDLTGTVAVYRENKIIQYPFNQFVIGGAEVGYTILPGKLVSYRKLSPDELKGELVAWAKNHGSANPSPAQECTISGRMAYCIRGREMWKGLPRSWRESYFIPFEQNKVILLDLYAPSEGEMSKLRQFLQRITIPTNAHLRRPAPPPPPTAEEVKRKEIQANLRMIKGAGDQYSLLHGGNRKYTVPELRQEFPWLARMVPIDGENYEDLVYDPNKSLSVRTNTLGEVHFP